MSRARHRRPGRASMPRPLASVRQAGVATCAAGAAVVLAGSAATPTSAAFSDSSVGTIAVAAVPSFGCVANTVTAPFEFGMAPLGWGSGSWSPKSALCSPNGRWVAAFQTDGNFVLYDMSTNPGSVVWQTWTFRSDLAGVGTSLALQADGNLVLYTTSSPRHTNTYGIPGPARLTLGDDGNLVLQDANGVVRWMSLGTQTLDCRAAGAFTCDPNTPAW